MKTQIVDRTIRSIADSFETLEGDGVPIRRAIPLRSIRLEDVDPMLLLDHFKPKANPGDTGFPKHPHRGFEIITYALSGTIVDIDEEGNRQVIKAGGLQKITAGSGIWHGGGTMEKSDDPIEGLQIWINLAKKDKGIEPEYQVIRADEIPEIKKDGALVRVLVGEGSPVRLHTPSLFLDIKIPARSNFEWHIPVDFQGYIYGLSGSGEFGPDAKTAHETQIGILASGERLKVKTSKSELRFFLAAGKPHKEPIHWSGPYVD